MAKRAALILNLGSPDSTKVADVRRYLKEFLNDPRVIDTHPITRAIVLNLFILPFRPKESAEAYSEVWTDEGSPLLVTSYELQKKVASFVDIPVDLAMRYGNPSIESRIKALKDDGVEELLVMPLYPHYAMSSYETVVVEVQEQIRKIAPHMKATTMQPFYKEDEYINALVKGAHPFLQDDYDHLLFSFHGIPERHLRKSDPSHAHCLTVPDCCKTCSPAHATCYKHQCLETVRHFVAKAGIPEDKYSISFQSRLGRDPWIKPYTDHVLTELPKQGKKKLLVMCPAFVADCLETLEEIAMRGKEDFLKAGGESFFQIPCLNTSVAWVSFLANKINQWT